MPETKKADLHTHSHYSDGHLSPDALVKKAKEVGLSCIALTDHDGINGVPEAAVAGSKYGIEVIPGVEIRCDHGEVLGLFVDVENPELVALMEDMARRRKDRITKTIKLMQEDGLDVSYDELKKQFPYFCDGSGPLMDYAMGKGIWKGEFWEIYNKNLTPGSKYRVGTEKVTTEKVIKTIKNAGGIAIWAHPWLDDAEWVLSHVDELIAMGLDGMEEECSAFKPDNYEEVSSSVRKVCSEKGLLTTRSTDHHSEDIGAQLGSIWTDYSVVEEMKRRLGKES